ncbi:MAG: hypothetical protein ACKOYM_09125 [Actinomycetes bacterium]
MTSLLVHGEGATAALHALAAQDAGFTRVASGSDIVVVAASAADPLSLACDGLARGAKVLVDPPLSSAALRELMAADAGRSLLWWGDQRRYAPAWVVAASTAPVDTSHVSVVASRPNDPNEGSDPVRVLGPAALAAVETLLGSVVDLSVEPDAVGTTVHVAAARGTAQLRLEFVAHTSDAYWHAQAAGAQGVVSVELAPHTLLERDGEPIEVRDRHRTSDVRLERLGFIDQLLAVADGRGQVDAADLRRLELLGC